MTGWGEVAYMAPDGIRILPIARIKEFFLHTQDGEERFPNPAYETIRTLPIWIPATAVCGLAMLHCLASPLATTIALVLLAIAWTATCTVLYDIHRFRRIARFWGHLGTVIPAVGVAVLLVPRSLYPDWTPFTSFITSMLLGSGLSLLTLPQSTKDLRLGGIGGLLAAIAFSTLAVNQVARIRTRESSAAKALDQILERATSLAHSGETKSAAKNFSAAKGDYEEALQALDEYDVKARECSLEVPAQVLSLRENLQSRIASVTMAKEKLKEEEQRTAILEGLETRLKQATALLQSGANERALEEASAFLNESEGPLTESKDAVTKDRIAGYREQARWIRLQAQQAIDLAKNATPKSLEPAELRARYAESVLWVKAANGMGSGFVIHATKDASYILTNRHVAEAGPPYKVGWDPDTQSDEVSATLVKYCSDVDLALLRTTRPSAKTVLLAERVPPKGGRVACLGFPLGYELNFTLQVTQGILSNTVKPDGLPTKCHLMDLRATHGNSGGPVFDLDTGAVMGVLTWVANADYGGYSFAIPSEEVLSRFSDLFKNASYKDDVSGELMESIAQKAMKWREEAGRLAAQREFEKAYELYESSIELNPMICGLGTTTPGVWLSRRGHLKRVLPRRVPPHIQAER